ncbi:FxDxF family PEP-CTERM protein [Janthinobacterium fluminis]|uniref:FxDxF family PEP-CTERM protein n=1 Tax=Janthinobacterium fluminis TaxID=2987524 RepID=A0ABT5JYB8_9BURK|nr:FxDxF family PEP-CTERM protein [Janthinobacterium fluminis]MDC8757639.1 FxDxF family PEP-CTERM protein [Janthinobacterium fluminis]
MKLKLFVASLLAAASFSALAADQAVVLSLDPEAINGFVGYKTPLDGILSGGSDVITFNGIGAGVYNITVTISGQNLTFDSVLSNLNGVGGTYSQDGKFRFFGFDFTGNAPFTLNLFGNAGLGAKYSGEVTITAVPEPETYGMLLGGLGLIAFLARRKAAKQV